jgi:hypothetical protein
MNTLYEMRGARAEELTSEDPEIALYDSLLAPLADFRKPPILALPPPPIRRKPPKETRL